MMNTTLGLIEQNEKEYQEYLVESAKEESVQNNFFKTENED